MNWTIPTNSEPSDIIDFVKEHGIAVLKEYISDKDLLERAKSEALIESKKSESGYKFGKAMRYGNNVSDRMPAIRKILSNPNCLKIEELSSRTRQEVFITHEFKSGEIDRNGYLHFDRTNTFKLFFYLMDVDEDCGPFRAIMDSHMIGKKLRTKGWGRTSNYALVKNRPAIDYPELGYTEEDSDPVVGPAGTLIVFDTDTLHKGGLVRPGKQRLILRTHCR